MASTRRIEQLSILIREMVARILAEDFAPPPGTLVTVTRVTVSEDLRYGRIFVSVLGGGLDAEQAVMEALTRTSGTIQQRLNDQLRMRPVPKISFSIDAAEKRRERIERLLGEGNVEIDSTRIS